ncbi:MAG: glutathione S-transferase family protein [Myxococcota bacterium]
MKLYTGAAPNPKRVELYLLEKGLDLPKVHLDVGSGESRTPAFLEKNPLGLLPVLELDDGTCLSESAAICRYLEELHPAPPLLGEGPVGRAVVGMWNRRMEQTVFEPTASYFGHTIPFFKDRIRQVPEYADASRETAKEQLVWLDGVLAESEYVAGANYSIADMTALIAVDLGIPTVYDVGPELAHLTRWLETVSARPAARALGLGRVASG